MYNALRLLLKTRKRWTNVIIFTGRMFEKMFPVCCICIMWPVTSYQVSLCRWTSRISSSARSSTFSVSSCTTSTSNPDSSKTSASSGKPRIRPTRRCAGLHSHGLCNEAMSFSEDVIFCWFLLYVVPLRASREVQPWHQEVGSYSGWSELPGSVQTAHQSDR